MRKPSKKWLQHEHQLVYRTTCLLSLLQEVSYNFGHHGALLGIILELHKAHGQELLDQIGYICSQARTQCCLMETHPRYKDASAQTLRKAIEDLQDYHQEYLRKK